MPRYVQNIVIISARKPNYISKKVADKVDTNNMDETYRLPSGISNHMSSAYN